MSMLMVLTSMQPLMKSRSNSCLLALCMHNDDSAIQDGIAVLQTRGECVELATRTLQHAPHAAGFDTPYGVSNICLCSIWDKRPLQKSEMSCFGNGDSRVSTQLHQYTM